MLLSAMSFVSDAHLYRIMHRQASCPVEPTFAQHDHEQPDTSSCSFVTSSSSASSSSTADSSSSFSGSSVSELEEGCSLFESLDHSANTSASASTASFYSVVSLFEDRPDTIHAQGSVEDSGVAASLGEVPSTHQDDADHSSSKSQKSNSSCKLAKRRHRRKNHKQAKDHSTSTLSSSSLATTTTTTTTSSSSPGGLGGGGGGGVQPECGSTTLQGAAATITTRGTGHDGMSEKPNLWHQLWQPSYKSRMSQFRRQFSEIPLNEKLLDDFMCALQRDILCQGRLYVSLNLIAFYSNILGYETVVSLNYREIKSVAKASTIKVFPNAIEVVTWSGSKYFFTSFVSRDRAFRLIHQLWTDSVSDHRMSWPDVRRLIRGTYDTNDLGVSLSEIDDTDVELDLSKKSSKKKEKVKSRHRSKSCHKRHRSASNQSSLEEERPEEPTDDIDGPLMMRDLSPEVNATVNAASTDFLSSWKQSMRGWVRSSRKYAVERLPGQSQVIRLLVLAALVMLIGQLIFGWYLNLLYFRLSRYHERLLEQIEQQIVLHSSLSSPSSSSSSSSLPNLTLFPLRRAAQAPTTHYQTQGLV